MGDERRGNYFMCWGAAQGVPKLRQDVLVALVRSVSSEPGRFAVSVPCSVSAGPVVLVGGVRGGRVRCRLVG